MASQADRSISPSQEVSAPGTTFENFSRYKPEDFTSGELTEWEKGYPTASCSSESHPFANRCSTVTHHRPCTNDTCLLNERRIVFHEPLAIFGDDKGQPVLAHMYHHPSLGNHPNIGHFEVGDEYTLAATDSSGKFKQCISCDAILAEQEVFSELSLTPKTRHSGAGQMGTSTDLEAGPKDGEVVEVAVCATEGCQSLITPFIEAFGLESECTQIPADWVDDGITGQLQQ